MGGILLDVQYDSLFVLNVEIFTVQPSQCRKENWKIGLGI